MEREDTEWRRGFIPSLLHPIAKARANPIRSVNSNGVLRNNEVIGLIERMDFSDFGNDITVSASSVYITENNVRSVRVYFMASDITMTVITIGLNEINMELKEKKPFTINNQMNKILIELKN